jgi:hypothetical protein
MQLEAEFRFDTHGFILFETRGNAVENVRKALWVEVDPML